MTPPENCFRPRQTLSGCTVSLVAIAAWHKRSASCSIPYRPVYITHELNRVTEPLLRTEQIDYLIVQDLDGMVRRAAQFMREIPAEDRRVHALEHVRFHLLTQFNIG